VLTGKTLPDKEHPGLGPEIVLVNARRYSVTTAKHKTFAVRASSHKYHIYVPRPDRDTSGDNLEYLNGETRAAYEAIKKARSCIDSHESAARACLETAKLYRKTFLKGKGKVYTLPKDFDSLLVAAREREVRHNVVRDAKREREVERYARQRELNALAEAEKIAAWRAGESVYLYNVPCMLRLKGPNTVETSLRAEIPLDHARRVYRAVLQVMASGVDFESNGHTIPAGVYKVDRISKDGTLRAGCHTISFDEIDRFAGERGWK
jgi:hypothetical protein